jgi:hypothetical protein
MNEISAESVKTKFKVINYTWLAMIGSVFVYTVIAEYEPVAKYIAKSS